MYFVPIRNISKMFIQGLSTNRVPEYRWKYSRRWLFIIVLICFCIVFSYKSVQDMYVIKHVSRNRGNLIDNRKKGDVVKKTSLKTGPGNGVDDNILKHIVNIKEWNLATITKAKKNTIKPRNIYDNARIELSYTKIEKNEILNVIGQTIELPFCEPIGKPNEINKTHVSTHNLLSEVNMGGYYYPKKCRSRHKVAVLVPYRNREQNLAAFMYYMHPFLMKQQLEYRIFVIEQAGEKLFNRGKLFNIGFMEMLKYNEWHCVVLHDVDLLPQSDKILYTCPTLPRHMVGTVVEKANLTYAQFHTFFGGVSALSVQHYRLINGFSNLYWGWGGEDNDVYWRILSKRLPMVRYNRKVAQYKSLPHTEQPRNNHRYQLLKFAVARFKTDGLSSLVYKVIWTKHRHLYTHILADVNPLKENITDLYNKMFH